MLGNFLRKIFDLQAQPDSEWEKLKKKTANWAAYEAESNAKMNSRQFRLDLVRSMLPQDDSSYRFLVKTDGQDLSNPVLQVIRRADDSVLAEWCGSYEANELDKIRKISFTCPAQGAFPAMRIIAAEPGKEDVLGVVNYSYKDRKKDFLYALGRALYIAEQSAPPDSRRANYPKP